MSRLSQRKNDDKLYEKPEPPYSLLFDLLWLRLADSADPNVGYEIEIPNTIIFRGK